MPSPASSPVPQSAPASGKMVSFVLNILPKLMAAMAAFKNRDVKVLQLFADDGIIFSVFDRI